MKDSEDTYSLKEYVESGEYFSDALKWYESKYIYPFTQRSYVAIMAVIILTVLVGISLNTYEMFPTEVQVKYSIKANVSQNKTAQIIRADHVNDQALASVIDIMIRNYIDKRESYVFSDLKSQFTYIKNNSTRIMFRRFYNNMSIDNPSSPVIRYKKSIRRGIKVLNTKYPDRSKATVKFESRAINATGETVENIVWLATIGYEIGEIDPNLPSGTRFDFTVTSYEVKLLEDKLK